MPQFAANLTMMFKEVDFLERFEQAASCGFKAVEFLWPYDYRKEELAQILKETGLKVALFNTTAGDTAHGEWGHAGLAGREADFKAEIEQALDYALALDCKTVHVMSAVVPYPEEKELCRQVFIKNMRMAADLFAQHGKVLTMEALCRTLSRATSITANTRPWPCARKLARPMSSLNLTPSTPKWSMAI